MKKDFSIIYVSLWILAATCFNVLFSYFVQRILHVPLVFMDTIGTIAVTFAFGFIPGLITAVITQMACFVVFHYVSWIGFLYSLSVWGAVIVVVLFNKKLNTVKSTISKIVILALISLLMCIVVSVIGGMVNSISTIYNNIHNITGDTAPQLEAVKADFIRSGFTELPANILSRIPGNIIERPVTTFVAYGIVALLRMIKINRRQK